MFNWIPSQVTCEVWTVRGKMNIRPVVDVFSFKKVAFSKVTGSAFESTIYLRPQKSNKPTADPPPTVYCGHFPSIWIKSGGEWESIAHPKKNLKKKYYLLCVLLINLLTLRFGKSFHGQNPRVLFLKNGRNVVVSN